MVIQYKQGDATSPEETGNVIICHICNNIGAWGAGFVLALSKKWKEPERDYRIWSKKDTCYLGQVQFVKVTKNIVVCNMIAQHGVGIAKDGTPPIRYEALRICLRRVRAYAEDTDAVVVGPRMGSGLSAGKWPEIKKIIQEELCDKGIEVTIYDL